MSKFSRSSFVPLMAQNDGAGEVAAGTTGLNESIQSEIDDQNIPSEKADAQEQ